MVVQKDTAVPWTPHPRGCINKLKPESISVTQQGASDRACKEVTARLPRK